MNFWHFSCTEWFKTRSWFITAAVQFSFRLQH